MRIFYKILFRAAIVFIIAMALLTLGINFAISVYGVKDRIRMQAEQALGMPIQLGTVYFNPFTGLQILKLTLSSQKTTIEASSASLNAFTILRQLYTGKECHGHLRIKKLVVNHLFIFRHVKAETTANKKSFSIDQFTAKIAEGKIEGRVLMAWSDALPYQLSAQFSGVSLRELLEKTPLQQSIISGVAQGKINLTGMINNCDAIQGNGTLEILQAQIKPADFLSQFGQLLQIEELKMLTLSEAKTNYKIASDRITIDATRLKSKNLILTARGDCFFNKNLNLDAQLHLNENLQNRLRGILTTQLLPSTESGYLQIPFSINGSIEHPQTDLLNKMGVQQLQNTVNELIRGFFRK